MPGKKTPTFQVLAMKGHAVAFVDHDGVACYHFGGALAIVNPAYAQTRVETVPVVLVDPTGFPLPEQDTHKLH